MVLVTDDHIYLNHHLKDFLDLCIQREKHHWDNVIIIDGKERSGKTTLMKSICHYVAKQTNKEFNLDHIFFDPEEMLKFATSTQKQVIVWDEAALGGMATQWQNEVQQKLNAALMVTGKYNHFYVFIIPSLFRLNRYLALDRSIALLHVYSPDLLSRGEFFCLNENQKAWVYNNNKKSETYGKNSSFSGSFTLKGTDEIINDSAYELKKDAAIKKYLEAFGKKKSTADSYDSKRFKSIIAKELGKDGYLRLGFTEQTWRNHVKMGTCPTFEA